MGDGHLPDLLLRPPERLEPQRARPHLLGLQEASLAHHAGAPALYRFSDDSSVSQLALNTYYKEKKVEGGKDWEFHFFPAFSFGHSPTGHWWNVLYGLAGYSQEGSAARMRLLYIPIKLSN